MFYFAVPAVWLVQRFDAGVTARQLAKYYAVGVVLCAAFEPFFVSQWWWRYTGHQPLNMTGLPMWWWFLNPMCVFGQAATYHLLRRNAFRTDWETALFVVIGPLSVFALHGSAAVPLYMGINAHNIGYAVLGSFGSIAIALMYMWIIRRVVTVPGVVAAAVPDRVAVGPVVTSRPAEPVGV